MLFTFPSRYLFAIGLSVVFSLAGWSPQIRAEFLVFRVTQVPPWHIWNGFAYGALTLSGRAFQRLPLPLHCAASAVLQPRAVRCHTRGLGSCAFARHYWRNHCYFLFLRVLRCFSSPRSLHSIRSGDGIATAGFPHSDIRGSRSICLSPRLFAAYHVLRRLREPQASPVRPFLLSCIFRLYDLATSGSLDSRFY